MKDHISSIKKLLQNNKYPDAKEIKELPSAGSNRIYFRIFFQKNETILASFNDDVEENIAWYSYSVHFKSLGFNVPEVYYRDESYRYFLLQDLGSDDLFGLLLKQGEDKVRKYYKKVIKDLILFQVEGVKNLDFDVAYPVKQFDKKSVLWDLNYFKYYFVKTHEIIFNENKLEEDFQRFADELLKVSPQYFMYRDFQARNIIIHNDEPWYIDFQGGRKGPLPYDLVSILFQAKANLSSGFREELYQVYLATLTGIIPEEINTFEKYFPSFVIFRLMQVLGAYGFRGIIQRKGHFLSSIPFAIKNIMQFLDENIKTDFPELSRVLTEISHLKKYDELNKETSKLTVNISSFSFKKSGYPTDHTENGGGFVFDCRALPNPGRIVELRDYNGTQDPIIDYLSQKTEVAQFLEHVYNIVDQSVDNYLERGFSNLQVNFGCTGGKHRSVYSAENLRSHLSKFGVNIKILLKHIQLDG